MSVGRMCLAFLGLAAHASAMQGCAQCAEGGASTGAVHTAVRSGSSGVNYRPVYTNQQVYSQSSPVYSQQYTQQSSGRFPSVGASSVDPCVPSPCGPNTECSIDNRGIGVCRCLPGYFPKPDTITGCGPQCTSASECGSGYNCVNNKCVRSGASVTGIRGTSQTIHRTKTVVSRNPAAASADPCSLGLCGLNANCDNVGGRAVCSCPAGYSGNPLVQCNKGECTEDSQCGASLACIGVNCVDPCAEVQCGLNANCKVIQHRAICSCPRGYSGDPFVSCTRQSPRAACSPSPCGTNTNCEVKNGRAICSCVQNYIGDPLVACRPECTSDAECAGHQACSQNRCRSACIDACGENARCDAVNHRPVCKCPQFYKGSPLTGCFPECTSHAECAGNRACIQLQCTDPCAGACGIGADCRVRDHTAICSCPTGYLGHPYDRCTPPDPAAAVATAASVHGGGSSGTVCDTCETSAGNAGSSSGVFVQTAPSVGDLCTPNPCGQYADCNPGTDRLGQPRAVCTCPKGYLGDPLTACQRGECVDHSNCPATQACYNYICTNPCLSSSGGNVCGTNALCRAQNHKAICYCPPEYTGEPLTECRLKPVASNHSG
ncbi:neurogenic locus notch homolog protein 1-like isoform X1 [Amphibalanus amphitrite]|uniref:neurogenic locus notch homolog protein 1-like isoform X1 n=1 Tax=Amphibalanus amphitrite TaxID=1232801 RepID=UPI001C910DB9|nr:neurogenic locus notch homolog protein 1-like isoform X1 [Amphibalanus amphitrite]